MIIKIKNIFSSFRLNTKYNLNFEWSKVISCYKRQRAGFSKILSFSMQTCTQENINYRQLYLCPYANQLPNTTMARSVQLSTLLLQEWQHLFLWIHEDLQTWSQQEWHILSEPFSSKLFSNPWANSWYYEQKGVIVKLTSSNFRGTFHSIPWITAQKHDLINNSKWKYWKKI